MQQHQSNTGLIAERLEAHPVVKAVLCPGVYECAEGNNLQQLLVDVAVCAL